MGSREHCKRGSAWPGVISGAFQRELGTDTTGSRFGRTKARYGSIASRCRSFACLGRRAGGRKGRGNSGLAAGAVSGMVHGIMTQEQDDIATMFETTNKVLEANSKWWEGIPAFADAVTRAVTGTVVIREKSGEQGPTGDAETKAAKRLNLEERMLLIADQLSALAAKTGDHDLAAKVDLNKSTMDRAADSDLLTAARRVQGAATANSGVLASDYAIPAEELAAFGESIRKFDDGKTAPRDAVVNRKVATLSLPDAIAFVRSIYRNELDKMMTRFRKTAPAFYAAYTVARTIVNHAATHASPKKAAPAGTSTPPAGPAA